MHHLWGCERGRKERGQYACYVFINEAYVKGKRLISFLLKLCIIRVLAPKLKGSLESFHFQKVSEDLIQCSLKSMERCPSISIGPRSDPDRGLLTLTFPFAKGKILGVSPVRSISCTVLRPLNGQPLVGSMSLHHSQLEMLPRAYTYIYFIWKSNI